MNMQQAFMSMDRWVPHRDEMSWLDSVLEGGEQHVVVQATIRPDSYFVRGNRLPIWTGIEYMAQAIAVWAGYRAHVQKAPVKIGLLLGTRRYDVFRQHFLVGETLRIEARCELFGDNGLGMFACQISIAGETVATANLSVFEPPDETAFLTSHGEPQ
jgi:predicted hotdog family 3-hydroxylacyl-ACP dehydratase